MKTNCKNVLKKNEKRQKNFYFRNSIITVSWLDTIGKKRHYIYRSGTKW